MAKPLHSETERVQLQSAREWLDDYEGESMQGNSILPHVIELKPVERHKKGLFVEDVEASGIISIRSIGNKLLITTDRYMNAELKAKIKQNITRLAIIAEPYTGKELYEYIGYRTFMSQKKPCLAVEFKELVTGEIAERYFNIELRNNSGKSFKTGVNREFRIVGNIKRPQKGMFIKFWFDAVKHIPDNRPSHIYRYMNAMLSNVAISCAETMPHHEIIKLTNIKVEGFLYDVI